ncbi:hypothetical protein [Kibdelosporangium aridum]|uniref:Uncharacterized protein n=1 Tax=Kibdelosporangium aridum TaxID=2030 RepID=A0A1W2FZE3_KIBAR|nr:hypothetical protein [Kibdelosporangium aridum]SMD27271.1 hypothetical protein SAMN05661093_10874 [Kibdelosporangium aridum]
MATRWAVRSGSSRKPHHQQATHEGPAASCLWPHVDGRTYRKRGDHLCKPRADHAIAFAQERAGEQEICVHTKDRWARTSFILAPWQRDDIVRPLFGEVRWDEAWGATSGATASPGSSWRARTASPSCWRSSRSTCSWPTGVEGTEIYGCAMDKPQAHKVFEVAARMVKLSPVLSRRLRAIEHQARIVDEKTGSYYEVVAADSMGNLGHNPSAVIFDEVLNQPNGDLWSARCVPAWVPGCNR